MSKQESSFRVEKSNQDALRQVGDEAVIEVRIPVRQLALLIAMYLPQPKNEQPTDTTQDDDLTPQECASVLRCSISTIYRRTKDQLPFHRIGNQEHGPIFIKRSDLMKLKTTKRLNGVKY